MVQAGELAGLLSVVLLIAVSGGLRRPAGDAAAASVAAGREHSAPIATAAVGR